ncbi:hypothetical protein [Archangium sp.]|uniref:hypothetical protein n=1 Tax=Archangium sp. TaxID=1872627 RepID=UPI002ED7A284
MISLRKTLGAAALVAAAAAMTAGCGGREGSGNNDAGDQPGCTGVCSPEDAGTEDAGTRTDAGTDAGTQQTSPREMTVAQARSADYGTWVKLKNVVVQTVESSNRGSRGDYLGYFWVVDPANPKQGLWVYKFYQDLPTTYEPKAGDRIDIEGWVQYKSRFEQYTAYRPQLANKFAVDGSQAKLVVTLIESAGAAGIPADNQVSIAQGFGNADGGFGRPSAEYGGSRVHIAGPLTLTNPNPRAMQRVSDDPNDPRFFGFEVEGGILVRNYKTFGQTDGGDVRCDWRALVASDGGSVTFPNGIRGVWETYTYSACQDLSSQDAGCFKSPAVVPGTELPDGGGNKFTYVLHPQNCAVDLAGAWDAGTGEE